MNFVNAMLTNNLFERYYKRLCGPLDMKCRKCWMRIMHVHEADDEIQLSNIVNEKSLPTLTSAPSIEIVKESNKTVA